MGVGDTGSDMCNKWGQARVVQAHQSSDEFGAGTSEQHVWCGAGTSEQRQL